MVTRNTVEKQGIDLFRLSGNLITEELKNLPAFMT